MVGAGIYGATTAIRLAEHGHEVHLFGPLGVLRAASGINQYRVRAGYHYPRSPETILEAHEAQAEFVKAFAPAIVRNSLHLYAIPKALSLTSPGEFEATMERHGLPFRFRRPEWMDFDFIDACYRVDEFIYDPEVLRELIVRRICATHVRFEQTAFLPEMRGEYDYVVMATYGLGPSRGIFRCARVQVAEKILIQLPESLQRVALVVIDGSFTAFDPCGNSGLSLFGSAKNTNHWSHAIPRDARRCGAIRAACRRGGVSGIAFHAAHGGRQPARGPADAIHPRDGAAQTAHFFGQGCERGQSGASGLREDRAR